MIDLKRIKYKLDIDLSDTSDDFLLEDLIEEAIYIVENYINRKLKAGLYKEVIDARETIWVKNTPIIDVIEVQDEHGEPVVFKFTEDRILVKKPKYRTITNNMLYKEPSITQYFVEYFGGFEKLPPDIVKILTEMVMISYREIKDETINIKSKNEGSVSISYVEKEALTESNKTILDKYRLIQI